MAANKGKKLTPAVDNPKCAVCFEPMKAPIFFCQSGHNPCVDCSNIFNPPKCPLCQLPMTQTRNRSMEELTKKVQYFSICPHRAAGCMHMLASAGVADHAKECIFRQMECPLGAVFGNCSWTGKLHQMMNHFKQEHPSACNAGPGEDAAMELENVLLCEGDRDRRLFLAGQDKLLFIITVKIDTIQRMVYWTVQHIGPKQQANQHLYEIHVNSKRDPQRKVIFTEHCFSDTVKVEDIIRQNNCAVLPLDILVHFIEDDKLSFRYFIRRVNAKSRPNENVAANRYHANARSASCSRIQGPGPQLPRPKGPYS